MFFFLVCNTIRAPSKLIRVRERQREREGKCKGVRDTDRQTLTVSGFQVNTSVRPMLVLAEGH